MKRKEEEANSTKTCVGERQVMHTNNSTQTTTSGDGRKTEVTKQRPGDKVVTVVA